MSFEIGPGQLLPLKSPGDVRDEAYYARGPGQVLHCVPANRIKWRRSVSTSLFVADVEFARTLARSEEAIAEERAASAASGMPSVLAQAWESMMDMECQHKLLVRNHSDQNHDLETFRKAVAYEIANAIVVVESLILGYLCIAGHEGRWYLSFEWGGFKWTERHYQTYTDHQRLVRFPQEWVEPLTALLQGSGHPLERAFPAARWNDEQTSAEANKRFFYPFPTTEGIWGAFKPMRFSYYVSSPRVYWLALIFLYRRCIKPWAAHQCWKPLELRSSARDASHPLNKKQRDDRYAALHQKQS